MSDEVLVNIADLRRKEASGERRPGTADRCIAEGRQVGGYLELPRARWIAIRDGRATTSPRQASQRERRPTPPPRPAAPPRPPKPKGPGDHLHTLIVKTYGIAPCQKCLEIMDRMNELGPAGCVAERQQILEGMWERRENLDGWRAIAAKLPGAKVAALHELGKLFDEAVARARG